MNINPNNCFVPELHPEIAAPGKLRLMRIEANGTYCICKPEEVAEFTGEDPGEYKITEVWMTQAELDALPEFMGF